MAEELGRESQEGREARPIEARSHRAPSRGQVKGDRSVVPESKLVAGRFGRMFRNLPSFEPSDRTIDRCVRQLVEPPRAGTALDNPAIPAGFTYLGQFVDHDLTFDPVSSLQRQNDPDGLRNFRTPVLDLDAVYGLGPADQPYLCRKDDSAKLLVGPGEDAEEEDLPRNVEETALIGDPRNDENIIVSQLHLAFLKLHNQLVDDIRDSVSPAGPAAGRPALRPHLWSTGEWSPRAVFLEAQRLTRWHYQWVLLKEFLPTICGPELMGTLLEEKPIEGGRTCRRVIGLEFYQPEQAPFIPVEWSGAAYRYGHSQIRPTYNLNSFLAQVNPDIEIFVETPTDENRLRHLAGGRKLPGRWTLDWRFFFEQNPLGTPEAERVPPQPSRLIDSKLAGALRLLPGISAGPRSLARRNLERGRALGLPSGQAVARRMCVRPLTTEQLGLNGEAPLWFYILKEAELAPNNGRHLGVVGGRIVAEVILGIMKEDPFSFLRTDPLWEPVLPAPIAGSADRWGVADLLAYAVPNDGRRFPPPGP